MVSTRIDSLLRCTAKFRQKLNSGGASVGLWMQIPCAELAEVIGGLGYDWVVLDQEHGSFEIGNIGSIINSICVSGESLPLVRLVDTSQSNCKRVMDAGVAGIIAPMVESAEELEVLISDCSWPPAGRRGVGFSKSNLFGQSFEEYFTLAQNPIVIAMIETVQGLENIDAISNVPGLDAVMIGPYDLSASLGYPGDFQSDEYLSAISRIKSALERSKTPSGIHVVQPDIQELKTRIEDGFQFIPYSTDALLLRQAANIKL